MVKSKSGGGGVSYRTKDATEGGGVNGARAVIDEIGWVDEFTYGGRLKDNPQTALFVKYDVDGLDKPWEDNYTVGPSDKWEVIADGRGVRSLGKSQGLNKGSKAYAWFQALEEAAKRSIRKGAGSHVDLDDFIAELDEGGQDISGLQGQTVILGQIPFTDRSGNTKPMTVVTAFVEANVKRGTGAVKAAMASKTPVATSSKPNGRGADVEAETADVIRELVAEHTSIKKGDLAQLILDARRKDPNVRAMMNLAFKEAFLAGIDGIELEKNVLRAAE